jgi:hypothetical protein
MQKHGKFCFEILFRSKVDLSTDIYTFRLHWRVRGD